MNYLRLGLVLISLGILSGIVIILLYQIYNKYKPFLLGNILPLSLFISGIVLIIIYYSKGIDYKPYLFSVYPAMDKNKTQKEYQDLFHSLGWYYQCCGRNYNSYNNPIASEIKGPNDEIANILRYPTRSLNPAYPSGNALWDPLNCCQDNDYKLPAIPQGYLYDWYSLQYFNVPIIISNENGYNFANQDPVNGNHRDITTYNSQSASTGFNGDIIYNNKAAFAEILISDPMGLQSNIPVGLWAGPGPFYAGSRCIQKAIYYPFGPQYIPSQKRWTYSGENDYTKWLNMYLTKSQLEAKTNKDYNMNKPWCNGFNEGDFIEVGHVEQIPGLPQSTGYWYNYFGGGGTGVFHKMGKTPKVTQEEVTAMQNSLPTYETLKIDIAGVSPRNKAHALFNLLWEIRNTKNLEQLSGGLKLNLNETFTTINGSTLLKNFYGTDDPWIITMWYANGYAYFDGDEVKWTQYQELYGGGFAIQGTPIPNFNGFSDPVSWAIPSWMGGMGPNQKLPNRQVSSAFILSLPQLGVYKLSDPVPGNASLSNFYGVATNSKAGVTFATLCSFLLQAEFGSERRVELAKYVDLPTKYDNGIYNTLPNLYNGGIQFPASGKPIGVGALTYLGVQYALTKVFMGNYFYDRVSNGVSFDEPINYFANVLGYKDIQMPCNTNSNGFWAFENIYVGLPSKEDNLDCDEWAYTWYNTLVEERKYAFITNFSYQSPAMIIFNKLWGTTNSMRDPFDVKSETKSMICYGAGGFPCLTSPQTICKKTSELPLPTALAYPGTKYTDKIWDGQCTTQMNVGMNQTSKSSVIWDNNNYCHNSWAQNIYGKFGVLFPELCCMGQSFCQVPGDKPTLSAIWNNVPYGGLGYGNGIVPLYSK